MRTELKKSFPYGFVLTEQELRRINDMMRERMSRISSDFSIIFELTFKNGIITELASIEEVLAEKNSGLWSIRGLKIMLVEETQAKYSTRILLSFIADDEKSITYEILSDEPDWVHLTRDKLNERIERVRKKILLPRFYFDDDYEPSYVPKEVSSFQFILFMFITLFILSTPLAALFSVLILLAPPSTSLEQLLLSFFIFDLLISAGYISYCTLSPVYNFCWGDYSKTFELRQSIAKYIIYGVSVTIILDVIASVIVNFLTLRPGK